MSGSGHPLPYIVIISPPENGVSEVCIKTRGETEDEAERNAKRLINYLEKQIPSFENIVERKGKTEPQQD